ncbi:DnaA regulatory inactivator Hda [Dokdonella sp. MW10]|uniref:DnaA regulatory inactivator Hda n=1 Tax=Dokdonella sp. MW10 TaxID=2992926 RepID=UPI003F7E5215
MSAQLPLALRWPAHQRFETFVTAAGDDVVAVLRAALAAEVASRVLVNGPAGSGRTHLLIAACAAVSGAGRRAQYATLAGATPERIRALGGSDLLALDDVDAVAGRRDAEHALFDLYNRCVADGTTLLFAASAPPAQIGIGLPDLVSRLGACTQVALHALDEDARKALVRERAAARGIELDDGVVDWLFTHQARDLGSLLQLLDRIDRESLAARRRVTLPFVRALLARDAVQEPRDG